MQWWRVDLAFAGASHFGAMGGEHEESEQTVESDTLFSALCHAWLEAEGEEGLEELLRRCQEGDPPFLFSSTFPYCGDTYYFPRPRLPLPEGSVNGGSDGGEPKVLKKARVVPLDVFCCWARGQPVSLARIQEGQKTLRQQIQQVELPRVALHRATLHSNLFWVSAVHWQPGAGLYFLVAVTQPGWLERLRTAVRLLEERGLGGDRSAGYGSFRATWHPIGPESPWWEVLHGPGNGWCLLSAVVPAADEVATLIGAGASRWELIRRQGWAYSPSLRLHGRRRPCWLLAPGSVFPTRPQGRMVQVTPKGWPHAVWRYGFALSVPVQLPAGGDGVGTQV